MLYATELNVDDTSVSALYSVQICNNFLKISLPESHLYHQSQTNHIIPGAPYEFHQELLDVKKNFGHFPIKFYSVIDFLSTILTI